MITLYQFAPAFGLPNASPFCFKVENYLRMTGEPYETRVGSPRSSPKGKLPFIKDGGVVVSDSAHIVQHLIRTRGDKLDAHLSARDRAVGHAVQRMFEEGTYFGLVYASWIDETGFKVAGSQALGQMPALARAVVGPLARRMIRKQIHAQGTGRHAPEDIYAMVAADVAATAEILGDNAYLLGPDPTSADAAVYAFLAMLLWAPKGPGLQGLIDKHPNLKAYCERMKTRYYP